MDSVAFRYRHSKPTEPIKGYFYWVDLQENGHQIWFAPSSSPDDLILLNDKSIDESAITELIERVADTEIQEKLNEFRTEILEQISDLMGSDLDYARPEDIPTKVSELENDEGYLTDADLEAKGYLTDSDLDDYIPDVEISDSDWGTIDEMITEKVNEKTFDLTWTEI